MKKGVAIVAIMTFSFTSFGYQYDYEVADDLSDQEVTLFVGVLRKSILKFFENQTDAFPMFFDVNKYLEEQKCPSLVGRIYRLVTFVYFLKQE